MRSRLLVTALVAAGAIQIAGCGISPTDPISYGPPPRARLATEQVYFVLDGQLHPVGRSPVASSPRPVARVEGLDLLAAGPLPPERDAGVTTELPPGIRMFPVEQAGDDLTLFLFGAEQPADPFGAEQPTDPGQLSDLAVAQIACTATAATTNVKTPVRRVTLRDKISGHERGPVSCPVPVPEPPG